MQYRRLRIEGATYFFTVVTAFRKPLFNDVANSNLLLSVFERVRNRHPLHIEAQVILPDHLHPMWSLPDDDTNYPMRWRSIKEAFTREYVKRHGWPPGKAIWQKRYWEHMIENDEDFNAHLDYIHLNPVHHGHTDAAGDWPNSTFHHWVDLGVYEPHWGSDALPELPDWAKRNE
jgi:putative transposase